jgi:hypothetical protein
VAADIIGRVSDPDEPEDTVPFTHRPYGKDRDENPFVSPSGPAAQPSGPSYVTPPPPPPPTVGPVPQGPPVPGQEPWQAAWAPAYGAPYAGSLDHGGAKTSLVLGIISIASLLLGFACCAVTLPGVFCAPFAWWIGAKAKHEIEASPGTYGNLSSAVTGMWMGIAMTFVGFLAVAAYIALWTFIFAAG